MKYPSFLKENDTIGLIATSCGSNSNPYRLRTKVAIDMFSKHYKIKKGHRLYRNTLGVSAPASVRGKDFNLMYKNKNIDLIWSTGGGELMMSMLPFVDFEKIKKLPPKYFVGFSDNTNLTFTITTICDVATIYANSIGTFAYDDLLIDSRDNLKLMKGEQLSFDSYPFYHDITPKPSSPLQAPIYDLKSNWKSLDNQNHEFQGRIIGGCLDVLVCLCGTKYDNVVNFIEKYKDDGIIFYFDICDLNSCATYRALFQLKEAGWFKYIKGFVIGRHLSDFTPLDYQFEDAYRQALSDLNVAIIYDSDFSHIKPLMGVINGAIAKVTYKDNKGNITYILK